MKRNNFREQLERRKREASSVETTAETDAKPASEMTDDELEAALTASRRELLDAQHAEVRRHAKEQAGISGGVDPDRNRPLAEVFRKRPNFK
jgi:hypothetical protein